ncbi:hypothetical protein BRADI_2g38166v3 [Brachypodium distachyon]|uniref:Uncharacterized protein n=1 Tax=Brachypodium distachyon TaxID=15368 RepID=A0A0Q3IPT9_BRADI|nr:hypothetical protein BRADI_2g38166v3 [Brachypodium distachyon]
MGRKIRERVGSAEDDGWEWEWAVLLIIAAHVATDRATDPIILFLPSLSMIMWIESKLSDVFYLVLTLNKRQNVQMPAGRCS